MEEETKPECQHKNIVQTRTYENIDLGRGIVVPVVKIVSTHCLSCGEAVDG